MTKKCALCGIENDDLLSIGEDNDGNIVFVCSHHYGVKEEHIKWKQTKMKQESKDVWPK